MTRNLTGWRRQEKDPRDWQYVAPRRVVRALAPTVDLRAGLGPQLDQGQLGSCGPNTADELIEYDQRAEGLPVTSASRLFIYYVTRQIMGTVGQDSGVDNRSLLKALNQYGFAPESLWPYSDDPVTFKRQPPQSVYTAALANRITNYAAVAQQLDQMKGVHAGRFPFMFGFDVFPAMLGDAAAATGIVPDPGPSDSPEGGHDVTFCGYTDVELPGVKPGNKWPAGTFCFRNHWLNADGTPWGDGGYGYISYAYATGPHASDFWVINAVPGGTPTPPNPPPSPAGGPAWAQVQQLLAQTDEALVQDLGRIPLWGRAAAGDANQRLVQLATSLKALHGWS